MQASATVVTRLLSSAAVVRAGGQALGAALVASRLGATQWGLIATLQVVANIATQFTASGLYVSAFEDGAQSRIGTAHIRRHPTRGDLLAAGLLSGLATSAAASTVGFAGPSVWLGGLLGTFMACSAGLSHLTQAAFLLGNRPAWAAGVVAQRPVLLVLTAWGFWVSGSRSALVWLSALVAVFALDSILLIVERSVQGVRALARNAKPLALRFLLVLGVGTVGTAMLRTIDQVLLAYWSDLSEVGNYSISVKLLDVGLLLVAARAQAGHSSLSKALDGVGFHAAVRGLLRRVVGLSVPLAVLMVIASLCVPLLLGDSYERAPLLAAILAASFPARAAFLVLSFSLVLSGDVRSRNLIVWLALVANLIANSLAIPLVQGVGAALSTVAVEGMAAFALWVVMRRRAGNAFEPIG